MRVRFERKSINVLVLKKYKEGEILFEILHSARDLKKSISSIMESQVRLKALDRKKWRAHAHAHAHADARACVQWLFCGLRLNSFDQPHYV